MFNGSLEPVGVSGLWDDITSSFKSIDTSKLINTVSQAGTAAFTTYLSIKDQQAQAKKNEARAKAEYARAQAQQAEVQRLSYIQQVGRGMSSASSGISMPIIIGGVGIAAYLLTKK
ncbi:MAG: hypothetical protein ACPGTP_03685 [Bacteroidia bacterium]